MGCGESKESTALSFSLILDPEEESLHLKSWHDASTRQRVLCDRGTQEFENANVDSRKALAFHSALMRDEYRNQEFSSTPVVESKVSSEQELCSSADTVDGFEADELKTKLDKLQAEQGKDKLRYLLEVDPKCWQSLAEQGYFQKAEDLLVDSAAAELKMVGRTARYAHCMHALGSLYDQRSNLDVTGQQQQLSLKSADYAQQALDVWEHLVGMEPDDRMLQEHRAASLLLRGRSLCNYAIDGDGSRGRGAAPTEDEAFAMAEAELGRALEVRERLGLDGLAEAVMAMGYLHYCRAGCLMRSGRHGPDAAELVPVYKEALRHYTRSLNLYIDRDGQVRHCGAVVAQAPESRSRSAGHGADPPARFAGHGTDLPVTVRTRRSRCGLAGHGADSPVTVQTRRSRCGFACRGAESLVTAQVRRLWRGLPVRIRGSRSCA